MRSGKGRHRRPRQAPALLVTAGVTGAGIATSLLGASGAQAVDASTWDSVAQCESGGAWSLNEENGYYGGLQLTLKSWETYGGTEFADRPDLASRSQQIQVAEKILAAEGPRAWPACAVDSGLEEEVNETPDLELPLPDPDKGGDEDSKDDGKDDDKDDADSQKPGDSEDSDGSDSDDSEEKERPDDSDGSGSPKPPGDTSVPSPDEREQDTDPDSEKPSKPGSGSGSTDDAEDDTADDADKGKGDPSGGHSGRIGADDPDDPTDGAAESDPGAGSGKHRGRPDPAEKDRADRSGRDDGHLVEIGDTLASIAERHELAGGWPELYETNRPTVGEDPDHILPGQLLQLGEQDDAEKAR